MLGCDISVPPCILTISAKLATRILLCSGHCQDASTLFEMSGRIGATNSTCRRGWQAVEPLSKMAYWLEEAVGAKHDQQLKSCCWNAQQTRFKQEALKAVGLRPGLARHTSEALTTPTPTESGDKPTSCGSYSWLLKRRKNVWKVAEDSVSYQSTKYSRSHSDWPDLFMLVSVAKYQIVIGREKR